MYCLCGNTTDNELDRRGNKVCTILCILNFAFYLGAKAYYIWANKERKKIWNSLSQEVSHLGGGMLINLGEETVSQYDNRYREQKT
jgi:hypothetical protein